MAGLVYVVVSGIFTFVKYDILHKILPPHVTGPIIILIGMSLAPVAISNATTNWTIAIITFATGVFVKIGFDRMGFKFLSLLPVLFALIVGYVVSLIVGAVDFSTVNAANWVGLPAFMLPKFAGGAMVLIVPVALVTMVEHFGDVIAIGNVVKKDSSRTRGSTGRSSVTVLQRRCPHSSVDPPTRPTAKTPAPSPSPACTIRQ